MPRTLPRLGLDEEPRLSQFCPAWSGGSSQPHFAHTWARCGWDTAVGPAEPSLRMFQAEGQGAVGRGNSCGRGWCKGEFSVWIQLDKSQASCLGDQLDEGLS